MSQFTIVLSGSPTRIDQGTTGTEIFAGRREIVAVKVNGELKDLCAPLSEGDQVEPVEISSPEGLTILRHSTAHVLAQAVQRRDPSAKLGIGPFITDGFYYDFDVAQPFTPEDLRAIEKDMARIVKEGQRFQRRAIDDDQAREEEAGEPYKLELIGLKSSAATAAEGASVEVGDGGLTMYDNVNRQGEVVWTDLCRGPHLPTTKLIGNGFALTRSAAA
ncbi:MAG: threonine--tRNA ligase, partial [Actinomycetia bacterium]|nr:threonine--tRNA ligase [Actinomycetes bacterium]